MQEVRLTLDPHVAKFLRYGFLNGSEQPVLGTKNSFTKLIISKLSVAPSGFKLPEDYNVRFFVLSNHRVRRLGVDVRYYNWYMKDRDQEIINLVLRDFFTWYACNWIKTRYDVSHGDAFLNKLYLELLEKFNIEEHEYPMNTLHQAYSRFKNGRSVNSKYGINF